MESEKRLPNLAETLFVLIGFGLIMILFIIKFDISIHLALLTTWFLIMIVGLKIGYNYREMQKGILNGINDGLEAVLVLLSVGALIGTWIAGGVVPSIIYYGLAHYRTKHLFNGSVHYLHGDFNCDWDFIRLSRNSRNRHDGNRCKFRFSAPTCCWSSHFRLLCRR